MRTVADMGWGGIKNGDLLRQAAVEFDVLLTTDRNMEFQQDLPSFAIALLVIAVGSNDVDVLRPFVPQMLDALNGIGPGEVRRVQA